MHYVFGLIIAGVLLFLIPYPWGATLLIGLLLGGVLSLADRVSRLEGHVGIKDSWTEDVGKDRYAEAERRRIQRILDGDKKG